MKRRDDDSKPSCAHGAAKRFGRRSWSALAIVVLFLVMTAAPASAHTGFESSSPNDGDTVDEPVSEITITFTGPAEPAGEGFVVLDAQGTIRAPDEVTTTDDLTFTLRFDESLAGGIVGVRWSVAAPDTHPIEGSFSFTVTAPLPSPTATPAPPTPTPAPTAEPTSADTPEPSATEIADPTATADPVVDPVPADGADDSAAADASEPIDLEEFLETGTDAPAGSSLLAAIGRIASLLGVVVAFGGTVFAAVVLRGERSDIEAVLAWVRGAGMVTAAGATIEAVTHVATVASGWSGLWSGSAINDALGSSYGIALALRLIGGALLGVGAWAHMRDTESANEMLIHPSRLSADAGHADNAWQANKAPAALLGALLVLVSFLFDGHTVSQGPRWLHAVANVVHVAAAATWAGGVMMLVIVLTHRQRRQRESHAERLGLRFSVVAVVALVAASVAGIALSVLVLDSVSSIWSTSWGRLLMIKVALVALAASCGGYNHKVVLPALERANGSGTVDSRFRTIITGEAMLLVAIAVVTALLVAASSV